MWITVCFLKYDFFYLVLCFTAFLLTPSTLHYLVPGGCLVYFISFYFMYVKFEVFLHTKKICKKCHISKFLAEVGFSNSKAYSKTTHSIEEITHADINYYKKFELIITELDKLVPIMYWLPFWSYNKSGTNTCLWHKDTHWCQTYCSFKKLQHRATLWCNILNFQNDS